MSGMLKIAIAGCGKIANAHASLIRRLEGCEIVGVCNPEPLKAQQFCKRYAIQRLFTEVAELLQQTRPDVVHITTPPESHFEIARLCLEQGCHVYVEKPFTVRAEQAERLLNLAQEKGLKVTVGHNFQFTHVARRMRALVESGYLGGVPVHMESYYGYDLADPIYARALLSDKQHWVRRLPGKLLHNVISHGVARIAEFLTSDAPRVTACGFVSPFLKSINENDIVDELRVILCEGEGTTAYFTFSTQMKPSLHEFRMYGPKNSLVLDQDHEILLKLRGRRFPSYANKFIPPALFAKQHLGNLLHNFRQVVDRDFHLYSGMNNLIRSFYSSILQDGPVPIPYREILLTARIMDAIFDQLRTCRSQAQLAVQAAPVTVGTDARGAEP